MTALSGVTMAVHAGIRRMIMNQTQGVDVMNNLPTTVQIGIVQTQAITVHVPSDSFFARANGSGFPEIGDGFTDIGGWCE